ncbi:MAG: hypothetical protein LBQ75_05665 [Zoogloeaceae bacterium]|jgi:hypothetical protein|nr:hypothetical protein [Zoogloeaceae bacterium]
MTYGTEHLMLRRDKLLLEIANIRSEVADINAMLASMRDENDAVRESLEERLEEGSDELEFNYRELEAVGRQLEELKTREKAASGSGRYVAVKKNGHFFLVGEGKKDEGKRVWTYEEITALAERTIVGIMGLEAKLGVYALWSNQTQNYRLEGDWERICDLIGDTSGRKDIADFLQGKITPENAAYGQGGASDQKSTSEEKQ